ncbi:MAG: hypothetical protein K5653_09645 [Clostridiales bacterium]|nr:hypothetical protein [Clostridiales bacterium]
MSDYKDKINEEINKASRDLRHCPNRPGKAPEFFGGYKDADIHSLRIKSDRIVVVERGEADPTNRYAYYTLFLGKKEIKYFVERMEEFAGLETEDFVATDKPGSFLWNLALYADLFLNKKNKEDKPAIKMANRPMNSRDNDPATGFLKEELLDKICCKGTEIYEGYVVSNLSYKESPRRSDINLNK